MEPGDFRVTEVKFRKKHVGHIECSREATVTREDTWCGSEDLAGARRCSPSLGMGTKDSYREVSNYQQGRRFAPGFGDESVVITERVGGGKCRDVCSVRGGRDTGPDGCNEWEDMG